MAIESIEEPLLDKSNEDTEANQKFDFNGWCKKNHHISMRILPLCSDLVEHHMNKYGENEELDEIYNLKEFSLLKGEQDSTEEKIEIEDATGEMKAGAFARLAAMTSIIVTTGAFSWMVIAVSGFGIGYMKDCTPKHGDPTMYILFPLAVFMTWRIGTLTNLMSKTSFETMPFSRIICPGSGFSNFYVLLMFSLLDISGKLTRAIFVAHTLKCSEDPSINGRSIEQIFAEGKPMWVSSIGFSGIACLSYVLGPGLMQGGRMLRSLWTIHGKIEEAKKRPAEKSMGIQDTMDDYGAIADWAMMKPNSTYFFNMALPTVLEDDNDAYRVWDLYKTKAITAASNIFPDSVLQMWLMSSYMLYISGMTDVHKKALLAFSIFTTGATTLKSAVELIQENFTITVVIGLLIVALTMRPVIVTAYFAGEFVSDLVAGFM